MNLVLAEHYSFTYYDIQGYQNGGIAKPIMVPIS